MCATYNILGISYVFADAVTDNYFMGTITIKLNWLGRETPLCYHNDTIYTRLQDEVCGRQEKLKSDLKVYHLYHYHLQLFLIKYVWKTDRSEIPCSLWDKS